MIGIALVPEKRKWFVFEYGKVAHRVGWARQETKCKRSLYGGWDYYKGISLGQFYEKCPKLPICKHCQ